MVDEASTKTRVKGGAGCLLPLIWMFAGHAVLLAIVFAIVHRDSELISLWSIGYWIVVGLVVLARYVDVTRYRGTTSDGGTPATLGDVKRWGAQLGVLATAAWVLAHAL